MPYLVFASSSLSKVFCRRSSSIRVAVTSFSRSDDSFVEIGGVTPRYLEKWYIRVRREDVDLVLD